MLLVLLFLFSTLNLQLDHVHCQVTTSSAPEPVTTAKPTTTTTEDPTVPFCPKGGRVQIDAHGEPRTCLPRFPQHCSGLNPCCYYNKVDYHCCQGVVDCPSHNNKTVVVFKQGPRFSPNVEPPAPAFFPLSLYDGVFGRPPGPRFSG